MKKRILFVLFFICVLIIGFFVLWIFILPKNLPVKIEVTLAKSVTCRIGESTYTFRLYPYDNGIYLLRVEKGNEFKTKVIVSGYDYEFLDLKIHVVKLIAGGVVLEIQKVE
jgi:cellulose synthase/poly-beta-1,6-N-acetylglucosamine synthase-like glycosyltransferase